MGNVRVLVNTINETEALAGTLCSFSSDPSVLLKEVTITDVIEVRLACRCHNSICWGTRGAGRAETAGLSFGPGRAKHCG
ncbi:hypothetical protein CHARACLAT_026081 [Characodon lateralis]|uniref:Uncharacterized protein n=1 Tax=Characodon lateralis TaxID=208331 RepID=A0ABU7EX33_9TELE|nr:hypothetical protein [Characodon lateralis]